MRSVIVLVLLALVLANAANVHNLKAKLQARAAAKWDGEDESVEADVSEGVSSSEPADFVAPRIEEEGGEAEGEEEPSVEWGVDEQPEFEGEQPVEAAEEAGNDEEDTEETEDEEAPLVERGRDEGAIRKFFMFDAARISSKIGVASLELLESMREDFPDASKWIVKNVVNKATEEATRIAEKAAGFRPTLAAAKALVAGNAAVDSASKVEQYFALLDTFMVAFEEAVREIEGEFATFAVLSQDGEGGAKRYAEGYKIGRKIAAAAEIQIQRVKAAKGQFEALATAKKGWFSL